MQITIVQVIFGFGLLFVGLNTMSEIISRQIANAHTTFNVLNTLLWLHFIWLLAKLVTFLVRGKEEKSEESKVTYLDSHVLDNPALAMNLATNELSRMAELAQKMMAGARNAFTYADMNEVKSVRENEKIQGT